jgi:heterodisulfide reductase subunit D
MAEMQSRGETPEILFWVGCAGSFDNRAQKVSMTLARVLSAAGVKFAILGQEELCTGDPARRAGNEFVFQMLAQQNIATLESYGIKKVVTACPHCFNTLKNDHDSCYLGRVNGEYDAPRAILHAINQDLREMKRSGSKGLCCGAGGAQMFKEDEPGDKRINQERIEEVLDTGAQVVAANCPFCITMLEDGLKASDTGAGIMVYDLSELILNQMR